MLELPQSAQRPTTASGVKGPAISFEIPRRTPNHPVSVAQVRKIAAQGSMLGTPHCLLYLDKLGRTFYDRFRPRLAVDLNLIKK